MVAGEETATCHREYGFSYRLDVATVFFNPSLGTERQQVARMVGPDERLIVPAAAKEGGEGRRRGGETRGVPVV